MSFLNNLSGRCCFHFILAAVLFCPLGAQGQELPPAEQYVLHLRIYGKDAKPISQKSGDYQVKSFSKKDFNYNHPEGLLTEPFFTKKLPGYAKPNNSNYPQGWYWPDQRSSWWGWWWRGDSLHVVLSGRQDDKNVLMLDVQHENESMQLSFRNGFDSLPFTPGVYHIPETYGPLFELDVPDGFHILNRDLRYFRTDTPQVFVPEHQAHIRNADWLVSPQYRKFFPGSSAADRAYVEIGNGIYSERLLHYPSPNGDSLVSVPVQLPLYMKNLGIVQHGPRIRGQVPVIFPDNERKTHKLIWVHENGEIETDTALSALHISSFAFANPAVWFAGTTNPDKTWSLYRTTDAGKTWEERNSNNNGRVAGIRAFDSRNVSVSVLINEYRPFDTLNFKSEDGGMNWVEPSPLMSTDHATVDSMHLTLAGKIPMWNSSFREISVAGKALRQWSPVFSEYGNTRVLLWPAFFLLSLDKGDSWVYYHLDQNNFESLKRAGLSVYLRPYPLSVEMVTDRIFVIKSSSLQYIVHIP